jgi:hypothetical protein
MPHANEHDCQVVKGTNSIKLSPAEVDMATSLLGIALRMQGMNPLPDHIKGSPFVIRFQEDDTLLLERKSEPGSMPFTWGEGDELIVALHDAQKMAINERVVGGAPRGAHAPPPFLAEEPL